MKKEMRKRGNEEMVQSGTISSFPRHPISSFPRFLISPSPHFPISALLLLAAFLRFQGLAWGLPCARHWFSYHPDEALILRAAANVNLFTGHLDPGFYNYGSFLIYCISLATQVLDAWLPLKSFPNEMARMTLVGRSEVSLFGVATVYVVYLIGRRIGGRRAGILSAAAMAVLPMHAVHCHFVTVDVPATFWVSVALYNALRWPSGRRAALWCGIAVGIAAGTKYNAGLVLLAGWAAIALAQAATPKQKWRGATVMTAATLAAFLCTTPGVLLATPAFLRDFTYEAGHVATGHGLVFVNTGPGWWYHLSTNLWQGIGAFLPVGIVLALAGRIRFRLSSPPGRGAGGEGVPSALILAAFALPYFALISAAAVRFQRYDMPLLPVLSVAAGLAFARLRGRWLVIPAAALAGTWFLAQAAVSTMSNPGGDIQNGGLKFTIDPRDLVADYFELAIPPTATIGITREPWFFSPPFSVANGGPQTVAMFERQRSHMLHGLRILDPGADDFHPRPDYVVISDYEYGDALRLQGSGPQERMAQFRPVAINGNTPPEAQRIARLWNTLMTQYDVVAVVSPRQRCMGVSWPKRTLPPHDSFYPSPTLVVFRRGAPKAPGEPAK